MTNIKCPFTSAQAAGFCHCHLAQEVVRRGGTEYDCTNADAHTSCLSLTAYLNKAGLPELGYEDDLTLTPKNIYDKILIGGLQGLRMALNPTDSGIQTDDIWNVVEVYVGQYSAMDKIPADVFLDNIKTRKVKRRRVKK